MLLLQCLRKRGLGNCCVLRRNGIMVHESERGRCNQSCNVADQTLLAEVNHELNTILVASGYLKKRGFHTQKIDVVCSPFIHGGYELPENFQRQDQQTHDLVREISLQSKPTDEEDAVDVIDNISTSI